MSKTVLHLKPISRQLARPLAIAAVLVVLALSVGGALAQRMEQRAAEDRLVIGDVTEQG